MRAKALALIMGRTTLYWSNQEKRGSWEFAGTMSARLRKAAIGQRSCLVVMKTDCVSPGAAVFAEGKTSLT